MNVDGIKARVTLEDVLRKYGCEPERSYGNYEFWTNPFTATHDNFSVRGDKWHSFVSGEGGDIFDLVQKKENVDFITAKEMLSNWFYVEERKPQKRKPRPEPKRVQAYSLSQVYDFARNQKDILPYLSGWRGISQDVIRNELIGAAYRTKRYTFFDGELWSWRQRYVVMPYIFMDKLIGWNIRRDDLWTETNYKSDREKNREVLNRIRQEIAIKNQNDVSDIPTKRVHDEMFGRKFSTKYAQGPFGANQLVENGSIKRMYGVLITEAEIDAMSALSHGIACIGATPSHKINYGKLLSGVQYRFIVRENDEGGNLFSQKMIELLGGPGNRNQVLTLPDHLKDLNDLHTQYSDVEFKKYISSRTGMLI